MRSAEEARQIKESFECFLKLWINMSKNYGELVENGEEEFGLLRLELCWDDFDMLKIKDDLDKAIFSILGMVYETQPKKIEHGLAEEVYKEIKTSFNVNKTTVWRRIEKLRREKTEDENIDIEE